MSRNQHINPVHLEAYANGDASGGITFKVFRAGTTTDITATINALVGIAITDIEFVTEVGCDYVLAADSDADGKRISGGSIGSNGGIRGPLATPHYCPAGVIPKVFGAPSGKTRCILHGFLYGG